MAALMIIPSTLTEVCLLNVRLAKSRTPQDAIALREPRAYTKVRRASLILQNHGQPQYFRKLPICFLLAGHFVALLLQFTHYGFLVFSERPYLFL
jgi:hypothetical protein